ncbi:MAG: hypothetical protein APF77_20980 [Clostridia bacterium BRH_c25]|nr:MAG: hypothetical protein APF77_20980 [Clostridia bacterium BRH_c25]
MDQKKEKRAITKIKIPHVYVLLFAIIIIAALCTYIVPSGQFEYVFNEATNRKLVDPDSFHYIEQTPANFLTLARAVPSGMEASVNIIMLVVLVIASFEIVNSTGALNAGIYALIKRLKGKESIIIAGMTILFAIIGGFLGWAEGILIFIPLIVSMTRAMGYDSLLGVGIVLLGGAAGFTAGPLNIYTTGICQGIAGLPLFSALEFRMVSFAIFTVTAIVFVLLYAKRLKASLTNSYVYGIDTYVQEIDENSIPKFTARRKIIVAMVAAGFILIAYGTAKWGWYLKEISGAFIILGILVGIVGKTSANDMSLQFAKGAQSIIPSALVIGIARGVLYIMEQGHILDTVIHAMANGLNGLPGTVSAVFINLIAIFFNFFVISASSKAAMLMPILMPLGDIINVNRQVITIAYQFGDGFTNYFWPTSGIVMAGLAMGGNIPWEKWAKWTWKIMLTWTAVGIAMVIAAQAMQLGPF